MDKIANAPFEKGSPNKPVVVLIHGLGMDESFWLNPAECFIGGGLFHLNTFIRKKGPVKSIWSDLKEGNTTVLTWSQSRPSGPVELAVKELQSILNNLDKGISEKGVVLVGHSRGGLIARKYLESFAMADGISVAGMITIGSPHGGSEIAHLVKYFSSVADLMERLLPDNEQYRTQYRNLSKLVEIIKGRAAQELKPGSRFLSSFETENRTDTPSFSAGGTAPLHYALRGFSFLARGLEKALKGSIPQELVMGKGDGLVSSASSVLPYAEGHNNFPLNHIEIAFDSDVREFALEKIKAMK